MTLVFVQAKCFYVKKQDRFGRMWIFRFGHFGEIDYTTVWSMTLSGVISQIWVLQKFRHCFIMVLAPSCGARAHILCTVHAGAKLWTHLARAAHEPTWEKTTFWIQISYNKSTCIRKLFEVAMRLKSEINSDKNTFLGLLLSIPGRKHACSKNYLIICASHELYQK